MAVISFASPKGGVGKTTGALVLAGELAEAGSDVTIIDADPNQPMAAWRRVTGEREKIRVMSEVDEENIIDAIAEASKSSKIVIVDLEGTAGVTVSYAVSRSDLVLIPLQGSQLDAVEAVKAINLIRQNEKAFRQKIRHSLVFTRTSAAIQGRTLRHVMAELRSTDVDILDTQLLEREAFRALFSLGGTLYDLADGDVSNLGGARDNASAFAFEVLQRLAMDKKKRRSKTKRKAA